MYDFVVCYILQHSLWIPLSRCFAHIPEQEASTLLSDVIRSRDDHMHFHVSCRLVAAGHLPLPAINAAIESYVPDAGNRSVSRSRAQRDLVKRIFISN
jgi:hypothetical protein